MCEALVAEESRIESYEFGGKFLPRGVLERKGFDMESIIPKLPACDIEENAVLGTTYRIAVKARGIVQNRGTLKRTVAERARGIGDQGRLGIGDQGRLASDC